jgi:hypothetical protein
MDSKENALFETILQKQMEYLDDPERFGKFLDPILYPAIVRSMVTELQNLGLEDHDVNRFMCVVNLISATL